MSWCNTAGFRAAEVTSVPLDGGMDNCCTEPDGVGRRPAASRNYRSDDIYPTRGVVLFSVFLRVVARAQKCSADIQRIAFAAAGPPRCSAGGGRKSATRRMDEACGTRSPTRPTGNSTRSSTYHPLLRTHAHTHTRESKRQQIGRRADESSRDGCEGEENPALIAAGEVDW